MRVVEMRREPDPGTILTAARGAADSILLVERRRQLADVEIARLERKDSRGARWLGTGPDLHAVDFLESRDERLRQLARALLDVRSSNLGLQLERLAECEHRRLVTLTEPLECLRDADAAGIRAEDRCPDLRLRGLVDEQDAVFLRAAWPLVGAAAIEIRLHVAQIDVEQPERLSSVDEAHDAALARQRADLLCREHVADGAGQVGDGDDLGPWGNCLGERVDVVLEPGMRVRRRHVDHLEAVPLRFLLPGGVIARVVVRRQQDFVAFLQVDAGRHEVVRFAGIARDHHLLRRHAEEVGEQLARVLAALTELLAVLERRVLIHVARHLVERIEHRA